MFCFIQATIILIIKFYKTISSEYYLKQSITKFRPKTHGFFNIPTPEMMNDPNDTHHHKPKLAIKSSKPSLMTNVFDNPLDDFSKFCDQTNHITPTTPQSGITSPPLLYT